MVEPSQRQRLLIDVAIAIGLPGATVLLAFWQPFRGSINWFVVLLAIAVSIVTIGRRVTGYWRGTLIDRRYMVSLSRFQMTAWTVVVLSGFFMAVMIIIRNGAADPLAVAVPQELWILLGISTTSLIGSPLVLSSKTEKKRDPDEAKHTCDRRCEQLGLPDSAPDSNGVVYQNRGPEHARLSDMFKGEETGNAATIDLPKVQMFYFTLLLVIAYCFSLGHLFDEPLATISSLPALPDSMLALLGISHAGYLAGKALPHSREQRTGDGSPSNNDSSSTPRRPTKKTVKKKATGSEDQA